MSSEFSDFLTARASPSGLHAVTDSNNTVFQDNQKKLKTK
jgi:hypothetical protein